jgi:hypothetical protein
MSDTLGFLFYAVETIDLQVADSNCGEWRPRAISFCPLHTSSFDRSSQRSYSHKQNMKVHRGLVSTGLHYPLGLGVVVWGQDPPTDLLSDLLRPSQFTSTSYILTPLAKGTLRSSVHQTIHLQHILYGNNAPSRRRRRMGQD